MHWRSLAVALLLALGVAACGEGSDPSGTPTSSPEPRFPADQHFAPSTVPDGWWVVQASSSDVSAAPPIPSTMLFARPGWSGGSGEPVLVVGAGDENDAPSGGKEVDGFRAASGVDDPKSPFAKGHLGHHRGWTYVTWYAGDWFGFAAGRGLTDDEVLAAGRAARVTHIAEGVEPTVRGSGLPDGFELLHRGELTPLASERIVLWRAGPPGSLHVSVGRSDPGASAIAQAWFGNGAPPFSAAGSYERVRTLGDVAIMADGPAESPALVDALLASVGPVTEAQWQELGRRILEVPPEVALGSCGANAPLVFAGVVDGARWAVGLDAGPGHEAMACQAILSAAFPQLGGGSAGSPSATSEPIVLLPMGSMGGVRFIAGGVPLGSTRVVVERPSGPPVDGVLGNNVFDPPHRSFAAAIPGMGLNPSFTVVAYDAQGRELARR